MRQRIFPIPRAWLCQFRWQEHDQASAQSRHRAIPNAAFCPRTFSLSCVLPAGGLAAYFRVVHGIDFASISRIDGVAPKFAVGGEQAALRGKRIADYNEISNLPVMRESRIHGIERRL